MSLDLAGGGRELVEFESVWHLAEAHVRAGGRGRARAVVAGACVAVAVLARDRYCSDDKWL